MSMHPKLIHQSVAAVLVVTTVAVGGIVAGVHDGDRTRSSIPGDRSGHTPPTTQVIESTATTGLPRCDLLPKNWKVRDDVVGDPGGGDSVNPWAAGNAAVANYFNELARLCPDS